MWNVDDIPARAVEPVDKQAERHKPGDAEDDVGGPVDEGAAEGEQPDDGEQDAERGDDVGVDEAAQVPGRRAVAEVQVVRRDAQHDSAKDQLSQAEDHGEEVGENHGRGVVMMLLFVGAVLAKGSLEDDIPERSRARLIILPGVDLRIGSLTAGIKKVENYLMGGAGWLWLFIRDTRIEVGIWMTAK